MNNETIMTLNKMGCPMEAAKTASTLMKVSNDVKITKKEIENAESMYLMFDYIPRFISYNGDKLFIRGFNEWVAFDLLDKNIKNNENNKCDKNSFEYWFGEWNNNTIQEIMKYSWITGKTNLEFLEAGIGDGYTAKAIVDVLNNYGINVNVTGIDKDDNSKQLRKNKINSFVHSNILNANLNGKLFDVVNCCVLTYLRLPKSWPVLIRACASFLKSDGVLLVDSLVGDETISALDIEEVEKFINYVENISADEFAWIMFIRNLCQKKLFETVNQYVIKSVN